MANPFLVLGGIAVGIITAAFGILQVPGWVASAQDASAINDVAQVSILQSASLSQTGFAQDDAGITNPPAEIGVKISTQADPTVLLGPDQDTVKAGEQAKDYAVVVKSESGKSFLRVDAGKILELASDVVVPTTYAEAVELAGDDADGDGVITNAEATAV